MRRLAPLAVIPLLAAGLIGFTGGRASAVPQAAQPTPSQTCILVIFCFPSPKSRAQVRRRPRRRPRLRRQRPRPSHGGRPPRPSAARPPACRPLGLAGTPPADGRFSSGRPSPSPTTPRDASAVPGLVVSDATWTMTVSSATMTGFTYKGNVSLPVAGGGTAG